jgi:hypothetical protein
MLYFTIADHSVLYESFTFDRQEFNLFTNLLKRNQIGNKQRLQFQPFQA